MPEPSVSLFAIGDLHLSHHAPKPMDRFGEHWRGHPDRIQKLWLERVSPGDVVALPGDLSWAMRLEEARPDLEWLAELPGTKVLIKGNHDYWWSSRNAVRAALPESILVLDRDAALVRGFALAGTRGWLDPREPAATPRDERLFQRELGRLERALDELDRLARQKEPRVVMLHYLPFGPGGATGPINELLRQARVDLCLYGHLHHPDGDLRVQGLRLGVRYCCVSADLVDFGPVHVLGPSVDSGQGQC